MSSTFPDYLVFLQDLKAQIENVQAQATLRCTRLDCISLLATWTNK